MKSRIVGLSTLAVVVAVATLAVGCSSSSSKSSNTIRIGLEAPITGSLSELGQGMLNGAKQAATQVNANGGVKICLGCAHLYRNRDALHDLTAIRPQHVNTNNLVACIFDNQFHIGFFAAPRNGVFHCPKLAFKDLDLAMSFDRIHFRQAD